MPLAFLLLAGLPIAAVIGYKAKAGDLGYDANGFPVITVRPKPPEPVNWLTVGIVMFSIWHGMKWIKG